MKKILRAIVVLTASLAAAATGSLGYFSSSATAYDNEIIVGSLRMNIDSTRAHTLSGYWATNYGSDWNGDTLTGPWDAYNVVSDVDGTSIPGYALETWDNASPGNYVAYAALPGSGIETLPEGNRSIWFTVRNSGTLPVKAYLTVDGRWINMSGSSACSGETGNDALINVRNIHVFSSGVDNCGDEEECLNLVEGLDDGFGSIYSTDTDIASPVNLPLSAGTLLNGYSLYLTADGTNAGNHINLGANEFVVVRMDLNFVPDVAAANYNCYQGATYLYDVTVNGSQESAPLW